MTFARWLVAIVLITTASAEAKPRRIVVLDFDGPRALAALGRSNVMALLGDRYEVVATKRWESAREHAPGHGPQQWEQAARQWSVDAVIEGWVQDEGGQHMLTVDVRDASTGAQIDTFAIDISDNGLSSRNSRKLAARLDSVLAALADRQENVGPQRDNINSEETRKSDVSDETKVADKKPPDDDKDKPKPKKRVAIVEPAADPTLGRDDHSAKPQARPAPRFQISAGAFIASRGLSFKKNPPDAITPTPEYPSSGLRGLGLTAALYPVPINPRDDRPSGIGLSLTIEKTISSYVSVNVPDLNAFGDYQVDHATYEGGVHYRYPIDRVSVDGELDYGSDSYRTALPSNLLIPNVTYRYIGMGAHAHVAVANHVRVSVGARYLYLLSNGDVGDAMWYGSGTASGLALDANVNVPIDDLLYLTASFGYRRVGMQFDQSGTLAMQNNISAITDNSISGSVQFGASF